MTKTTPEAENIYIPDDEDFVVWQQNPVTRFVIHALNCAIAAQHEAWLQASWVQGKADQEYLTELRVRADTLNVLAESSKDDYATFIKQAKVK